MLSSVLLKSGTGKNDRVFVLGSRYPFRQDCFTHYKWSIRPHNTNSTLRNSLSPERLLRHLGIAIGNDR